MKKLIQLNRNEMRKIKGGITQPSDCSAKCSDGSTVECSGQTCTAMDDEGCSSSTTNANGSTTVQAFSCG